MYPSYEQERYTKLRNSLKEISQIAHIGFWTMDAKTLQINWSEEACELVGKFKKNGLIAPIADLQLFLTQEDYETIYTSLLKTLQEGTPHHAICSMHHLQNGQLLWIESRAHRKIDSSGKVAGIIGTIQDITKEYKNHQELQESHRDFQNIFENAQVGMMYVSGERVILEANQHLAEILGYSSLEEMRGLSALELHLSKEHFDAFGKENFESLRLGATRNIEYQLKRKDGSAIWTEISGTPLDKAIPADLQKGALWVVSDISLQKEYQEKLARSELLQKNILTTLPDMIWLKDTNGIYLTCNKEFELFFGATKEEIVGKSDYDFVKKELADFFRDHDSMAMEVGKPLKNEEWITYASDGRSVLLETTKTPLRDENNKVLGILGIGHDITQREEYAQALLEAKEKAELLAKEQSTLLSLFSKGDAVLFKWKNSENWPVEFVSKSVNKLFGYTHDDFVARSCLFASCIHPDDFERVEQEVAQALETKRDFFKHKPYRIITREHQIKWILDYTAAIKDNNNTITHFIGYVLDITAEKHNEEIRIFKQELEAYTYREDKVELLTLAVNKAEEMTRSKIGFFHFVEDNEETVSLQVWSSNTLEKMCFAEGHSTHYPISQAGVWVDCVHQRKSVYYNDYNSLAHKKGLPVGHSPLTRFATVPLLRQNKIVAIMGVGNKEFDYTEDDIETISSILDIAFDMYERQYARKRLKYMAYYDLLTGLPNRSLFSDRLSQAISLSDRSGKLLAVCYLDLDNFKPVNDKFGHHFGDQLLVQFAQRLSSSLMAGDTIARLGGDEFALILSSLSNPYEIHGAVEQILHQIKMSFDIDSHRIHISCSMGITIYPTDHADADTLLRHADQAMYQAKATEKSSYKIYDPVESEHHRQHQMKLNDFTMAISKEELELYYQPKIDLRNGEVIGFEALIRWIHPIEGLLYPEEFLPMIENTPQELDLGEFVVKKALEQLYQWYLEEKKYTLSVNISPSQMQLEGFVEFLARNLQLYPRELAQYLELEILEIAAVGDLKNLSDIMNQCKSLGVQFALDDFGTGYSSLTYFYRLPIDILKIDQNFVRDIINNAEVLDIVEGILHMSKTLDRPVIAEGVETIEIALMLLYQGCHYAQGFGIAKPMPAAHVDKWLSFWFKENIWKDLHKHVVHNTSHYDILVAIFSHHLWLEKIQKYLAGELKSMPPLDENSCQFAHWYKGSGRARYSSRESYAFIQAKHHQVHQRAFEIETLLKEDKKDEALNLFNLMLKDEEGLVDLLKKLAEQNL